MALYAGEFAVFNVKPPFQIHEAREWRRISREDVAGALSRFVGS